MESLLRKRQTDELSKSILRILGTIFRLRKWRKDSEPKKEMLRLRKQE